jgi:transcriptional regulator with XRE-family HTH domain
MKHSLPDRLRLLRQEKSLTQESMAKAILVPRVTYTHYELGKRTPDLDTILRLADFHLVSVDFLLGVTWLRPTLEKWLSGKPGSSPDGPASPYPLLVESPGELIADSPKQE